jgi:hypothetical protein
MLKYAMGKHTQIKYSKACFKRRASHVPNALETIDNETFQLIIYCFKCFWHMRSRRLKQA